MNIFDKGVKFFYAVLLSLLNFLNRALHLADIVFEITKPATQAAGFASDQIDVLLVHLTQFLELVRFVLVSEEATVAANGHLASFAVVAESGVVLSTEFLPSLLGLALLLLHQLHHIGEEATGNQLVRPEGSPAMRTLWSCLFDPSFQAIVAGELGAVRTHYSLLDRPKADKTAEELIKLCLSLTLRGSRMSSICSNASINSLNTITTIIASGRG